MKKGVISALSALAGAVIGAGVIGKKKDKKTKRNKKTKENGFAHQHTKTRKYGCYSGQSAKTG